MKILLFVNDGIEKHYSNNELRKLTGLVLLNISKKQFYELLCKDRFANEILYPIIVDKFDGTLESAISVLRDKKKEFLDFISTFLKKGESIAFSGVRREYENAFENEIVKHDFSSIELAREAARELIPSNLKVDLKNPDVKIKVIAFGRTIILAWSILENIWKKRLYRKNVHKAALRPTVAAYLASLGSLDIYDPMCGYGTVAFEALALKHEIPILTDLSSKELNVIEEKLDITINVKIRENAPGIIYCSDASKKGVEKVIENLEYWREELNKRFGFSPNFSIEFAVKDVLFHEPFQAERIVTNPPYGMRSTRLRALPTIYKALSKFAYKSGAEVFDVITCRYELMKEIAKDLWVLYDEIDLYLNNLYVRIMRFREKF